MKQILIILGLLLLSTTTINAQEIADNTIGVRLGDHSGLEAEITYQRRLGDKNRLEAGLAWRGNVNYNNIKVTALYQWVFDFEPLDGMNWYFGGGGGIGSWSYKSSYDFIDNGGTYFFVAGDIGAEYKFDFPLLVSLDFRPEIGFADFNDGFGVDIGISARYTFN